MTQQERLQMIFDYARKVVQYPRGSKGYDPVDMMNLESAFRHYDEEQQKANFISSNSMLSEVSPPSEQYPDNEADGIVFCGKCGAQK